MNARPGLSLAARSALSGIGRSPPGARHCWVRDPPEAPGLWPGLLVGWSRAGSAGPWQGRVVYAIATDHQVVLVEALLDASHLSRVSPVPQSR